MSPTHLRPDPDFGDDLTFTTTVNRCAGGTWVTGRVAGHRFQALVFAEHAEDPGHELGGSRVSKLWVRRIADGRVVFNWDRGADVPAADAGAREVVDFLAGDWPGTCSPGEAETPTGVAAGGPRRLTTAATAPARETGVTTTRKTATGKTTRPTAANAKKPAGTATKKSAGTAAKKPAKPDVPAPADPKGMSALDAAARVLGERGVGMTCQELIGAMAAKGYWSSPGGKTPAATLYAAVLREITVKGTDARFVKTAPGRFAAAGSPAANAAQDDAPAPPAKKARKTAAKSTAAAATIPDGSPGPEGVAELFRI